MAEALNIETLEAQIAEVCTKITILNKREADVHKNTKSEIYLIERDVLLRRIRTERRELKKKLSDYSTSKSLLENHVEVTNESSDDDEDNHEDESEGENEDTLELFDTKAAEYKSIEIFSGYTES